MANGEAPDNLTVHAGPKVDGDGNGIAELSEWMDLARMSTDGPAAEVVTEAHDVSNTMVNSVAACHGELLALTPDRGCARSDPRIRMATLHSASRGIDTRAIFDHRALRDRRGRRSLSQLRDAGAHLRVASTVPGPALVIDRERALLPVPMPDASALVGLVIVQDFAVLAWVMSCFEQLWLDAAPITDLLGPHGSGDADHTRVAILRLLAEGEKDEAISRRLSVSVRTCRRHIAEYMAQVGASSRFQAGVIAARSGHLDAAGIE
jgi:DNA-binding CsgD family transcriptional regulator